MTNFLEANWQLARQIKMVENASEEAKCVQSDLSLLSKMSQKLGQFK